MFKKNCKVKYCDIRFLNCFAVALFLGVWLLQITSAIETDNGINDTIYIDNGTESVDLSCGKVPPSATAIEWFLHNSKEWQMILKFEHIKLDTVQQNAANYSRDKYDISESVPTSLVIKNIDLSDIGLFKCVTKGTVMAYSYTILLKVVGKFNIIYY